MVEKQKQPEQPEIKDQIKLEKSGYTAHLKTAISYGDHQQMQAALYGAAKGRVNPKTQQVTADFDSAATIEYTYKKILTLVVKFVNKDGNDVQPTRKVIEDLPMQDGKKLEDAVDALMLSFEEKKSETESQ